MAMLVNFHHFVYLLYLCVLYCETLLLKFCLHLLLLVFLLTFIIQVNERVFSKLLLKVKLPESKMIFYFLLLGLTLIIMNRVNIILGMLLFVHIFAPFYFLPLN